MTILSTTARADLAWLDREFGHFLLTPHWSGGRATVIELSQKFRDHIFLVDRVRRKPSAPTWRFMTDDFAARLREYEKVNDVRYLGQELRRVLDEIGYPFDLSAEELKEFREHPRRKRFASVRHIADSSISTGTLQSNDMFHIRDVIAQLRKDTYFVRHMSPNIRGNLKARIDRLLMADGDAEFCVLDLGDATKVSREKLEREGFRLKPGNLRSGK